MANLFLTLYEKRVEENDLPFFISLMKNIYDKSFPSPKAYNKHKW